MPSIREQAMARIAAALTAAAPGGAQVMRSRETAITRALSPAIVVMAGNTTTVRQATGADRNQFECLLEIFVRGDPWTTLADVVDVAMHPVIMTDATLATIVSDVRRTAESFESTEADRTAGALTVHYQLTYLTHALDIARAG
jgi:hypothetical protein